MKKLMSGLLATTLAATFAIATVAPLNAAPAFVPSPEAVRNDVQTVQYQPWRKTGRYDHGAQRHDGRSYRHGDVPHHNAHRGYREYHHGYHNYNGYWYPAAAFIAGALITGAINDSASSNDHASWCASHYRSYRAWDNTYQPYHGPRRHC